ncbi:RluA family pseudouridine synthase [Paenibacillus albiflavus]|uniref:Pseudouridine synthase n=1 Tax=Paenibacillus albiflavus TaxID=2545760 RepID=A0A4R4E2G3_9BACL|nr:RluA family pseudouridine synthase [Paenibacillus albiflavus]TCZ73589.1 RluA family pseudouridine synthase [Paenibacillus albiflavus]
MNRKSKLPKDTNQDKDKVTEWIVQEPTELMTELLNKLAKHGRNSVKSILARGQVSVEGKVSTKYNYPLQQGHRVTVHFGRVIEDIKFEGLKIIHEDQDIIVIHKEAGLLSIASPTEKELTAYRQLTEHVRRIDPKNRIFVVHRLDRDTSGLMLYAKNEETQQKLQNSWQESVLERSYVALVEGAVKKQAGTIKSWLKESKTLLMYSSHHPGDGQEAITHYKVLESNREYSLLEVQLETGRKNQIRVHMKDIGHPIVGDKKYGSRKNIIGRLGLHARVLAFQHPTTGETMRFETQIPGKLMRPFTSQ